LPTCDEELDLEHISNVSLRSVGWDNLEGDEWGQFPMNCPFCNHERVHRHGKTKKGAYFHEIGSPQILMIYSLS
jgi:hypothetical protein